MPRLLRFAVLAAVSLFCALPLHAQAERDYFNAGMRAFEAGDFGAAAAQFDSLVARSAAWSDLEYGAAAYWLGAALRETGQDSAGVAAWRAGVMAMLEQGSFDVRLADSYLDHLMAAPGRLDEALPTAVDLYVNLLYNVDALLDEEESARLRRHVAQLALVAPAGVMQDAGRGDALGAGATWSARSGAGPLLVTWWRSQDPVPATRSNERLEEHLRRVAHVQREFSDVDRPAGVDDRGEIYLRYGPPEEEIKVRFDDPVLTDIVYRPGVAVSLSDFPDNEFWVFGHIDRSAWFLFVEDKGSYRIAETEDLVPNQLRTGFGPSQRGRIKAGMTIAVLQNIFRQLAPLHPDFAIRYAEVDNYAMRMPEFQPGRLANRTSGSLAAIPGGVTGETQAEQPTAFIQTMMVKSRTEDDESISRREEYAPRVYTEALSDAGELRMGYRTVRYLEPDGSTRTVIHWSPEPGELRPGRGERRILDEMAYEDSGRYLLTLTAVQKTAEYLDRVVHTDRFLVDDLPNQDEAIPVQQTTLLGDTTLFNVAMQWDQYAMGASRTRKGPRIRVATAQLDSLPPLNADPGVLEMSDLLPMTALLASSPADFVPTPYPFGTLTRELQLALSFEVYHLAFGADDQTRYTVSFDVARNDSRGGFLSLRGRDQGTSSSFQSTGTSRKANEMILIDLQSWEGSGELDITVTVTDDVSGQAITRDITFELR
ncbi:MAG: GWxTD domain-containing protein [Rhodothermales bacterium]|nr:GWxTD domain-containing protein [Rhodothermales bacterium]MBO6779636.1 GWxTD domain-containing protein [Rhodothermales bacterium]